MLLEAKGDYEGAEKQYALSVEAVPEAEVLDRLSSLAEARGDFEALRRAHANPWRCARGASDRRHPKTAHGA